MEKMKDKVQDLKNYLSSRIGVLNASEQTRYFDLLKEIENSLSSNSVKITDEEIKDEVDKEFNAELHNARKSGGRLIIDNILAEKKGMLRGMVIMRDKLTKERSDKQVEEGGETESKHPHDLPNPKHCGSVINCTHHACLENKDHHCELDNRPTN